jgi:hypothetical protein
MGWIVESQYDNDRSFKTKAEATAHARKLKREFPQWVKVRREKDPFLSPHY